MKSPSTSYRAGRRNDGPYAYIVREICASKASEPMNHTEYYLSNPPCLSMPVSDADKLLGCGNLHCMQLYIYLLRMGKSVPAERIAQDLNLAPADLKKAAKELKAMGLMSSSGKGKVPPEQAIPEYGKQYIAKRCTEDTNFEAMQAEAAQIVGHSLSAQELNTLFGIYDHLGLPAEVIYVLLHHCKGEIQEKYGPGRLPTMRQIEQTAYIWAKEEIMTLEMADEYVQKKKARKDDHGEIKRLLGIYDRALTKSEVDAINDWLDKGFGMDAIAMAFDRTVAGTGSFKLAYMNKIIQNWHQKGLHTPAEIEVGDVLPGRKQPQPAAKPAGGNEMHIAKGILDLVK